MIAGILGRLLYNIQIFMWTARVSRLSFRFLRLWFEEDSWRLQIHNDCPYQQQVYSKQSNPKQKEQHVRKFLYKNLLNSAWL